MEITDSLITSSNADLFLMLHQTGLQANENKTNWTRERLILMKFLLNTARHLFQET